MDPSKKRKNEGSSETDLILAKKQKTNEVVVHKDTSEESDIIKVLIFVLELISIKKNKIHNILIALII